MKKLHAKNEMTFAIVWIVIYVLAHSLANSANAVLGIDYSANAIVSVVLSVVLFGFIRKNNLMDHYGLCKTTVPAAKFLWYIPLVLLASHNLWNGFAVNLPLAGSVCYIIYMLGVGFLEEAIFRGLLFKAIAKDNVKEAIIISSVTFGLGHIVNLFNASGMELIVNVCQVVGAIAIGFLFVTLYYRGGSLVSAIITHAAIDVASCFANEAGLTPDKRILFSLSRLVIVVAYTLYLHKTLPRAETVKQ